MLHYEEWDALLRSRGIEDADLSPGPELAETYLRLGRVDDAAAAAARHEESARIKGQPWALARAARTRGLLAPDGELAHEFDEALALHEQTPDRYEAAAHASRLRRTLTPPRAPSSRARGPACGDRGIRRARRGAVVDSRPH